LKDLLPLIVLLGTILELFELSFLLVQDFQDLEHVGISLEELRINHVFMELMNLCVQLRDELIESSLEGLHGAFLLTFNVANNTRELRNLLDTLGKVILIFFLNLELELSQRIIDLPVEVNTIADILEVFINIDKMTILLNELFYIGDRLAKV
jgi:hypothetical protein